MRITAAQVWQVNLPVKNGPYTMAGQDVFSVDSLIVALNAEGGWTGWGEVCPLGARYAPVHAGSVRADLELILPALIGVNAAPLTISRAIDEVICGANYARSAIDIAVHDVLGKSLAVPVSTLLGGALRDRCPSYYATGIGTPEDIARLAIQKVAEGYPRIQIKAGGRELAQDIETIRRVWQAVGNSARLAVDCNRSLSQGDAIRLSQACADIPFVLEQPCDGLAANTVIRPMLRHPLYLDESITSLDLAVDAVARGTVDGFGMKISRLGGLSAFATFRDICAARGLMHTCDDSWGGNIVAAACTQMAATVAPAFLEGVWLATPYQSQQYGPDACVQPRAGHVDVPQGAGLGIAPDPAQFGAAILAEGS